MVVWLYLASTSQPLQLLLCTKPVAHCHLFQGRAAMSLCQLSALSGGKGDRELPCPRGWVPSEALESMDSLRTCPRLRRRHGVQHVTSLCTFPGDGSAVSLCCQRPTQHESAQNGKVSQYKIPTLRPSPKTAITAGLVSWCSLKHGCRDKATQVELHLIDHDTRMGHSTWTHVILLCRANHSRIMVATGKLALVPLLDPTVSF